MIDWALIDKSLYGELTPAERETLDAWLSEAESHRALYAKIAAGEDLSLDRARYDTALAVFEAGMKKVRGRQRYRTIMRYAAVALIPLAVGLYVLFGGRQAPVADHVVEPGRAVATLTLSSGETVPLGTSGGHIVEAGETVAEMDGEGLVYGSGSDGRAVRNTLTVPRGGEYRLTLSDGTQVWLNSDSRLSYPVAFAGGRREVALTGEAYFKVATDREKPFIVKADGYDVVVTGTEFNVRSFGGGAAVTTLVEGAVDIYLDDIRTHLRPGQQAVLADGCLSVADVNAADYISWKDGYFNFIQQPLGDILEELARWYDIEVVYDNRAARDYRFVARFSRYSPIGQVLDVLMKTRRMTLNLDGRRLTVL